MWPFTKPKSQPLRSVVAYRTESLAVTLRKQQRTGELKGFLKDVPKDQREAAVERAATMKFETPEQRFKRHEPFAFAGMRTPKLGKGSA